MPKLIYLKSSAQRQDRLDDLLNRILWYSAKGSKRYPAKYASAAKDDDDDEEEAE